MNRKQAKEFFPIMQAFAEGRVIECRTKPSAIKGTDVPNDWTEMKEIEYWNNAEYRIKPEPKYRPFANAGECRVEMCKHHPLGWVKTKQGTHRLIVLIDEERLMMGAQNTEWSYRTMFNEEFTFADGAPFGIKEEG